MLAYHLDVCLFVSSVDNFSEQNVPLVHPSTTHRDARVTSAGPRAHPTTTPWGGAPTTTPRGEAPTTTQRELVLQGARGQCARPCTDGVQLNGRCSTLGWVWPTCAVLAPAPTRPRRWCEQDCMFECVWVNLNLERVFLPRILKFSLVESLAPVIIGHFLNFGNGLFLEIVLSTGNPTEFSFCVWFTQRK